MGHTLECAQESALRYFSVSRHQPLELLLDLHELGVDAPFLERHSIAAHAEACSLPAFGAANVVTAHHRSKQPRARSDLGPLAAALHRIGQALQRDGSAILV